jgi:hypothetical protein
VLYKIIGISVLCFLSQSSDAVKVRRPSHYDWCMNHHNNDAQCKAYAACRREELKAARQQHGQDRQKVKQGRKERRSKCLVAVGLPSHTRKR